MKTARSPESLRIPAAFAFSPPRKAVSLAGKWVVTYYREHFTHTVMDCAYFWRKADALAFYRANV